MSVLYKAVGNTKTKSSGPFTTSVVAPATCEYRISTGAFTGVSFGAGPWISSSRQAAITYTTRIKGRPLVSNMCRHYRKTMTGPTGNISQTLFWPSHDVYYEFAGQQLAFGHDLHAIAETSVKATVPGPQGFNYLASNGQSHMNDAAVKLHPDLTTMSLPNFLIDLKQCKDLAGSVRDAWHLLPKLVKALDNLTVKSGKSAVKSVAGLNLAYSFGWRPTVSDLQAIVEGMFNLSAKLKAFNDSLQVTQTGTYTNLGNFFVPTMTGTLFPGGSVAIPYRATFQQQCVSRLVWRPQNLVVINQLDALIRGLLDTLGIELNPRIIWDAIPFSFVVDWFVGVGNFLETFKIDALELPIVYVDSYLQYKEMFRISTTPLDTPESDQSPNVNCGTWETVETYFHRMPLLPDFATLASLKWKHVSTMKLVLGASLGSVLFLK